MKHDDKYLSLAAMVSSFSTCLRSHFGVVIVKDDQVLGIGYNGPARGVKHCEVCRRADCPSGVGYEKCIAVHAEVNAIIQSGGREKCLGATLYIASHKRPMTKTIYNILMGDFPCNNCARVIVNAGIKFVVQRELDGIREYDIKELIQLRQLE